MKVLSFSYCFPCSANPTWGIFVKQRLAAMASQAELQVVSPTPWFPGTANLRGAGGPRQEDWDGLTVHRPRFMSIPKVLKSQDGRLYANSLRVWLKEFVSRWEPDILDSHFIWPDGVGVSNLADQLNLPYTITLRGWLYEAMDRKHFRRQCVRALLSASAVISVEQGMADLAHELGVPSERIHVIPNGADTSLFQVGEKSAAREELGLPQDAKLLVTVAHLGRRKGHYETIAALANLPDNVQLILVGGAGPSGGDQEDLQEIARSLGVERRIIFAGKQSHDRIPTFYQAADASVLASWREGCPNAVLESLACGTPVIATDVGAVRSMIEPGVNGQIVPVQNVQTLGKAIEATLLDPPAASQVRQSPIVRSWDLVASDVLEVFRNLI